MDPKSLQAALFPLALLLSLCFTSSAQMCNSYRFASNNNNFRQCVDLPVLNAFLHWNYEESTGTAQIAFRVTRMSRSNWVAWGLNPNGQRMLGTQAIVAYTNSSGQFSAYTAQVTTLNTQLPPGSLTFGVSRIEASLSGEEAIVFATLELPSNFVSTNQVWQVGPVSGGVPQAHRMDGENMRSAGSINFQSGQTAAGGGSSSRQGRKNTHGVLNAVSWGVLMPMGAIMARHVKVFASPAWFYLHVACQSSGYVVGVAGWATGIKLGDDSPGVKHSTHRNIGISIFVFGTLQVFALLLRPKPDHKYRLYWAIYHRVLGYATIVLSIINIYEGFDILDRPDDKWEWAYSGVLIFLGACALVLEAVTWAVELKRKKDSSSKSNHRGHVAANGAANGHGVV